MESRIQKYVDDLFHGYDESPELADFKEEIKMNLTDRFHDLKDSGLDKEAAFTKAVAELGDITAVADEISKKKRNEVIGQMYVHPKAPLGMKHVIGYVAAGAVLLFGIFTGFTSYFATQTAAHGISAFLPFFTVSGTAFVFLGLTQETSSHFPMNWGQALIYAAASGLLLFGLTTALMLYVTDNMGMHAVFGSLIPFVVPGVAVLAFLLLTEKSRLKPWVLEEQKIWMDHYGKKDPHRTAQGGLLSGALWIFAIAMVILAGYKLGFIYAIVVFLLAVSVQLIIEFWVQAKSR
jgi:hypothetical protein